MLDPRKFSFGGTSAIVTSMGLIIGLGAAKAPPTTIVSGLLIVGVADNMTDSLSIHMHQEAEKLEERAAFKATLTNFVTRLLTAFSFVIIVLALPKYASIIALAWGFLLLVGITYILARTRGVSPVREVVKRLRLTAKTRWA
jgi:hypothetical protein